MLHPDEPPRVSYLQKTVQQFDGPSVAVSDYVRLVSEQIASVDTGRPARTRNRRIRPERYAQGVAPVFRNRCRTSGGGDVVCPAPAGRGSGGEDGHGRLHEDLGISRVTTQAPAGSDRALATGQY